VGDFLQAYGVTREMITMLVAVVVSAYLAGYWTAKVVHGYDD
jgi:hypothetical protein